MSTGGCLGIRGNMIRRGSMIEIWLEEDFSGRFLISLANNGRAIKEIAEVYEKEYAVIIASNLAKNSNCGLKIEITE
jgi:hypothetical protein